jgi:transcriptional regulator with XRE-family HTH domain
MSHSSHIAKFAASRFRYLRDDTSRVRLAHGDMAESNWFLKEHRKAAGLTLQQLADKVGTSVGYLSDLESGKRRHNSDWQKRLADALEVEPIDLMRAPATDSAAKAVLVPIIGRVGADPEGRVIYATGQESGDMAPLPPGGSRDSVAVEVIGHSMRGWADDGSLIYFESQRTPPTPDMIGYPAVVETLDGQVLLKRLLKGSRSGLFDLESLNGPTMEDQRVIWAAEITAIIPPKQARRIIKRRGEAA